MPMMKAVLIHQYGGPEVLTYTETLQPQPNADEVLIRVHAAAVNRIDLVVRAGYVTTWFQHQLPLILGWDVSGTVEAVGRQVTGVGLGDAVYARTDINRNGAYAEFIVVRAAEVVPKPATLDHIQAAAVPHAALTAWQALFDAAQLSRGQTVLIHGAAGGVGHMAVQLAHWCGARVIGTASGPNLAFLHELGVEAVVDYTSAPFETIAQQVDVVLDTIGGETQQRSWGTLKPGGVLVSLVQPPDPAAADAHGVQQKLIGAQPNAEQLAAIGRLIDAGQLQPTVSMMLPLAAVQEAHAQLASGHMRGKLVLQIVP